MLRALLLSLVLIDGSIKSFSQKRDNIWMLGTYTNHDNYGIDFNSGIADTFSIHRNMDFYYSNASICDSTGQLLFCSNGNYIANRLLDSIGNSDNFNPGSVTSLYQNGIITPDGLVIIQKPGDNNKYYIIHESGEAIYISTVGALHPLNLSYSEIDMSLQSGLGAITQGKKNLHLLEDTLTWGRISAVKHGNGRDWWIVAHRFNSDLFYKMLFTPDTIKVYLQSIGMFNPHRNYYGQAIFSKDGSKYCIQLSDTALNIFDFDRCNGILSNSQVVSVTDTADSMLLANTGCAFSESGRFLYTTTNKCIHQFDTWAPDINATDQIVAVWDTFYSPGETIFWNMRLAPDHRIYLGTYVGTNILHYIEYPDSFGIACNVIQNSFFTPSYNTFCFPNSPNWDLGPSTGSICDSLINYVEKTSEDDMGFEIYPDPAKNNFSIKYSGKIFKGTTFTLFDNIGKEKIKSTLNSYFQNYEFDSGNLTNGIYFYLIQNPEKILKSGKLIIAR
jgi:hypothetical protein